ncbi:hypothetical protein Si103_01922 [Streptococcus infantarius subsp. infantarius]|nr:hypothetical protein [Streptococcus infantarius subsp. infantarius]
MFVAYFLMLIAAKVLVNVISDIILDIYYTKLR